MADKDIQNTALTTAIGMFEYLRMHLGFTYKTQTSLRFINEVYLVLALNLTTSPIFCNLRIVFQRIEEYGLSIKISQCEFGVSSFESYGY